MISALRIARHSASLTAVLGATGLLTLADRAVAEEPVLTRIGHFQIPFDVETEPGQRPEGFAVLYGSQDGGTRWDQLQSVPANRNAFMFSAPRDGRYSFAIRMTDPQGNVLPPTTNTPPELDVVVDTVAPDLKLELSESSPGQVVLTWTCTDASVSPESLAIEYADGVNGRWKPLQIQPGANGQQRIPASAGSVLAVRASISDRAGNRAEASTQLVSRTPSSPAENPAPPLGQFQSAPLGTSPFAGGPAPMQKNTVASQTAFPSSTPPAGGVRGIPVQHGTGIIPVMSQQPGEPQLVNSHIFDVDYQVEDVGPSGVSAVELFVTENGGQQWFRYGSDADLRSPFQVNAQSEGNFGFAVRIRNGLGFAEAPPQPGQAPEIIVMVDESPPVVELAQPSLRADGFGTLDLAWRVTDLHPSETPVRLEYSSTPNGPWTPVFDWQPDQGGYQWAIRPGTPASLYFRLLARDAAGNVGMAQNPQAVIVDLKKPVGRLLRVQAVSQSSVARP